MPSSFENSANLSFPTPHDLAEPMYAFAGDAENELVREPQWNSNLERGARRCDIACGALDCLSRKFNRATLQDAAARHRSPFVHLPLPEWSRLFLGIRLHVEPIGERIPIEFSIKRWMRFRKSTRRKVGIPQLRSASRRRLLYGRLLPCRRRSRPRVGSARRSNPLGSERAGCSYSRSRKSRRTLGRR